MSIAFWIVGGFRRGAGIGFSGFGIGFRRGAGIGFSEIGFSGFGIGFRRGAGIGFSGFRRGAGIGFRRGAGIGFSEIGFSGIVFRVFRKLVFQDSYLKVGSNQLCLNCDNF